MRQTSILRIQSRFQSTPPMRVATLFFSALDTADIISIHATHAGGDRLMPTSRFPSRTHFNPRHPCGWRRCSFSNIFRHMEFQSTPPMRVATCIRCTGYLKTAYFNPRHPCGWRHHSLFSSSACANFNPRHPCGWRPTDTVNTVSAGGFQSTPPMRVATGRLECFGYQLLFQSTPPMRVATTLVYTSSIFIKYFNPRHPCGWRLFACNFIFSASFISIHATHAGGD